MEEPPTTPSENDNSHNNPTTHEVEMMNDVTTFDFLQYVTYRTATPTDIFQCFEMEKASYPREEAASKNDLRYQQHHAAAFFRCAVLPHEDIHSDEDVVIGYICGTRCEPNPIDDSYSMTNDPEITSLMIHSVVVRDEYQNHGLGKHMIHNYIESLKEFNHTSDHPIGRIIGFVKENLLGLCLRCGFSVLRPRRTIPLTNGTSSSSNSNNNNNNINSSGSSSNSNGSNNSDSGSNNTKPWQYLIELSLGDPLLMAARNLSKEGGVQCFIVDSFASAPGTGNPASVVVLPKDTDAEAMSKWMQTVAAEFNLSETAFIWPSMENADMSDTAEMEHWKIRYYTPQVEVALCGHATLASAAILFHSLSRQDNYKIVFHAKNDELVMERASDVTTDNATEPNKPQQGGSIFEKTRVTMEFPTKPPRELETPDDRLAVRMMLEAAFSCKFDPLYVGIADTGDILLEVKPENFDEIGYEKLNFKALVEWGGYYRGVIVSCLYQGSLVGDDDGSIIPDFLSRFFGPKVGINEDPVTGSAHCVLGPYYSQKLGKELVIGKQMSERKGIVECHITDGRVRLTGTSITTVAGTLMMRKEETTLVQRAKRGRSTSVFDDE